MRPAGQLLSELQRAWGPAQRPPLQISPRAAQHCAAVEQARPVSDRQVSPQATKPVLHVYWHVPAEQVAVALGRLHGVHDGPHVALEKAVDALQDERFLLISRRGFRIGGHGYRLESRTKSSDTKDTKHAKEREKNGSESGRARRNKFFVMIPWCPSCPSYQGFSAEVISTPLSPCGGEGQGEGDNGRHCFSSGISGRLPLTPPSPRRSGERECF